MDAEEPAGRHARVVDEPLKVAAGGKPLAQLPGTDCGNRKGQVLGDLFQRDAVFQPPIAEGGRKARRKCRNGRSALVRHGLSLHDLMDSRKELSATMQAKRPGHDEQLA